MTVYGVTDTGFVLKSLAAILQEMEDRQRADVDTEWNTDADSLGGQYNGIIGDALAQLWEVHQANYYALSRDGAQGAALDIIGALNGTPRNGATKSKVVLTLSLNAGITVPAGSIVSVLGNPSIRVVTLAAATNGGGSPASIPVAAQAETAGPITALSGQLSVIETPVAGWTAVTNADPLAGCAASESDPLYFLRQLDELAAAGGGTVPGLRADLLQLEGVTAAIVIENDTDDPVDGLPGHSLEAIVLGGDDDEIAETLWANKAGGIYTHGSEGPITVTGDDGVDHEVRYSRPTTRTVYVAIDVETDDEYPGDTAVEDAVFLASQDPQHAAFLGISDDVYAGRIVCVAIEVDGVLNARVGLSFTPITDPDDGDPSLAISSREIASIITDNIVVNS
jgi:uncharacterized phage protein gp47/JayE